MTPRGKTFSASMDNNGGRNIILNTQAIHKFKMLNVKPVIDTSSPITFSFRESLGHAKKIKNPDPSQLFSQFPLDNKTKKKSRKSLSRLQSARSERSLSKKSVKNLDYEAPRTETNLIEQKEDLTLTKQQQILFDSFANMLSEFSSDECEKVTRELWRVVTEKKLLSRYGENPA